MKHSYRHECLHKWSALTEKTAYDWSTFSMRRYPSNEENLERRYIAQCEVHLRERPTQFRRPTTMTMTTSQRIIIIHNQSPPTISMIFDYNYINGNGGCTWLLLATDRISSGLPAAPRLPLRVKKGNQDCLYLLWERRHYELRLSPPEAPLSRY